MAGKKPMSAARDRALDKKAGIKEGSARDIALDKKRGIKPMMPRKAMSRGR